ncbi:MAG: hypothetical protein K1W14_06685 [Muribaculaceae bacterium]
MEPAKNPSVRSVHYLQTLMEVMKTIRESKNRFILPKDFQRIADIYSDEIEKELQDNGVIFTTYPRPLRSNSDLKLLRYMEIIQTEIDSCLNMEEDRLLSNLEKKESIEYGRKGYAIAEKSLRWSRFSIIVAALVALGQTVQWIIMIIQLLRQ